jgi:hypothetical protein
VLRTSRREAAGKGMAVALAFGEIDAAGWKGLRRVIENHTAGPSALAERRQDERHAFRKLVAALDERASRVVMGHDISRGGMRIDPHPDLQVGHEIRLSIYGEPGCEPISVRAKVVRDDGAAGLALRFRDLPADVRERIESLVASLPAVEALDQGEVESLGAVVSEITS